METIHEVDRALKLQDKFISTVTNYWPDKLDKHDTWVKTELHDMHALTVEKNDQLSVLTLGYLYLNHLSCDFVMADHPIRLAPLFKEYKIDILEKALACPNIKDVNYFKAIMKHADVVASKTKAALNFR